jgi:hypothetical protein
MAEAEAPIPAGWKLWTEARVPPELTKFAMAVRDHINDYPYNQIAETTTAPDGRTVGAFKSVHTWTYKKQPDGTTKLLTGLHIPGISLVIQDTGSTYGPYRQPASGVSGLGDDHPISQPHPHAARFPVLENAQLPESVSFGDRPVNFDQPLTCPALPSGSSAVALIGGDLRALPLAAAHTAVRAALVGAGLLAAGERAHVVKKAVAGSLAIEAFVLAWAAWKLRRGRIEASP